MRRLLVNYRKIFALMAGGICLMAAAFAEDRLSVVNRTLDQYETSSDASEHVSQSIKIPFEFLLAQGPSLPASSRDAFPDFLLKDENIPDELKRMLEDPESFSSDNDNQALDVLQQGSDNDVEGPAEEEAGLQSDAGVEDEAFSVEPVSFDPVSLETAMIDHLQLKDMDIVDVLKLLSQKSNLNIIAGRNVKGNVSIYLKDVKLKDALKIILDANDLAYQEEDGIIRVMTAAEYEQRYGYIFGGRLETKIVRLTYAKVQDIAPFFEQIKSTSGKIISDENSNTLVLMDTEDKLAMMMKVLNEIDFPIDVEVFALNYALAKEIAEKIEPVLTKNVGSVKYDERSNKIVVADVTEKINEVRQIISAFDIQDQQVLIEAKIVQIKLTDSMQFGVNWERVFPGADDLKIEMDFDTIDVLEPNKGLLTIGTVESNNYTAIIEALKKLGETNILSSPSITAVNNQEAKILVGSTQPYVTTTVTTPASGPTTTAESVTFIDVGVKLYVTPTIHQDGFITMKIRPEVSSVMDELATSQNNTIPIVETSEAETTVRIKDGSTIVIGGLIKDEKSDSTNKVPFLGDIPVVGAAFRNRSSSTIKTEIAIFLTPKIVSGEK